MDEDGTASCQPLARPEKKQLTEVIRSQRGESTMNDAEERGEGGAHLERMGVR